MTFDKIYQYNFPTIIRFGIGSSKELGDYLIKNNLQRPLIVTDPNVSQLGFFKELVGDIKQKNILAEVFHDIHKNPVKSDVYKGTNVFDNTIVADGWRRATDSDPSSVIAVDGLSIANGEPIEYRSQSFRGRESNYRSVLSSIDRREIRSCNTHHSNGFSQKVDVLDVGTRCYSNGIAGLRSNDGGLNSCVCYGNLSYRLRPKCSRYQDEKQA